MQINCVFDKVQDNYVSGIRNSFFSGVLCAYFVLHFSCLIDGDLLSLARSRKPIAIGNNSLYHNMKSFIFCVRNDLKMKFRVHERAAIAAFSRCSCFRVIQTSRFTPSPPPPTLTLDMPVNRNCPLPTRLGEQRC